MRSRDGKEVIKQAQQLVDAGYKEIVLTVFIQVDTAKT